jgi:ArsR family metal-binding transcriptional regulator
MSEVVSLVWDSGFVVLNEVKEEEEIKNDCGGEENKGDSRLSVTLAGELQKVRLDFFNIFSFSMKVKSFRI